MLRMPLFQISIIDYIVLRLKSKNFFRITYIVILIIVFILLKNETHRHKVKRLFNIKNLIQMLRIYERLEMCVALEGI